MTAAEVIAILGLEPHPEGGWYRQTFRDAAQSPDGRAASTAIYFLLEAGQESRWHRVHGSVEVWFFHAGAPLLLSVELDEIRLGPDLAAGERPQGLVPAGAWQKARSLGDWTLVSCTVAPGFEFANFEMAPEGWTP
ncbi:cupin domain-containing protein [Caulobacter mirabilis]|uniref:Cupin n=1 Tax=Caulobacter mirabilis TaxID=69666 RepID=A0A2D2AUS1_9CAUL|nr:cupin domain-containing protein [Caulobacter mirabilis]ATQ41715.1 cupin [Caulobacter mirabilis]